MFVPCDASNEKRVKGLYLEVVLYVPQLDCNLVSCSSLDNKGFSCEFDDGFCTIKKNGRLVSRSAQQNGLYTLSTSGIGNMLTAAVSRSSVNSEALDLWHGRLGHVEKGVIKNMADQALVSEINLGRKPSIPEVGCEPCVEGKPTRSIMKSRTVKPIKPGEVTHSDVCGPFPIQSIGGARYFVTFIYAHSGYVHINMIHSKGEVGKCFAAFEKWFGRKFCYQVKLLYSDNGGEYQAISQYREENGIEWEPTAPYAAERHCRANQSHDSRHGSYNASTVRTTAKFLGRGCGYSCIHSPHQVVVPKRQRKCYQDRTPPFIIFALSVVRCCSWR